MNVSQEEIAELSEALCSSDREQKSYKEIAEYIVCDLGYRKQSKLASRMNYAQFRVLVQSISDSSTLEDFISACGQQEWMLCYANPEEMSEKIIEILTAVWGLRDNPIKGIKSVTGDTNRSLSEKYGYGLRNIENWSAGLHLCSEATAINLAYIAFCDAGII